MQLCLNQKMFSEVFSGFMKATENLEYFETDDELQMLFFSEIIDFKNRGCFNFQKPPSHNTYGESTY